MHNSDCASSNKPTFVYNPELFDPEKHLPPVVRHLGDWARLLLDIIERRHLAPDCIDADFVCLHSKVLEKRLPKDVYHPVRTALERAEVIQIKHAQGWACPSC
jgi:hypothetical protein